VKKRAVVSQITYLRDKPLDLTAFLVRELMNTIEAKKFTTLLYPQGNLHRLAFL